MPQNMSPPRGMGGDAEGGGSPGAFELDTSLCDIPMDIKPPSPKKPSRKQTLHTPFLHTAIAKKAFEESQILSHSQSTRRPGSADMFGKSSTVLGGNTNRRHGTVSPLLSPTSKKMHSSLQGGRSSVEPQLSGSVIDSRLSFVLERRSMSKGKGTGGVKKRRPELFVLEAEQRALEGQQKAMERESFDRKRSEATIHVTALAKQYNDLKKQRVDFERELALLHDRKAALDAEAQGEEHRTAAHNALRIQDLSAKLEYWTLALREEEGYTKTLLHMKTRSAADKHARDIETAKFKETVKAHEHDLFMLTQRYQEAQNEANAAQKQLNDYCEEMNLYVTRRDARLGERNRQVEKMQSREAAMRRLQAEEEALAKEREKADRAANEESMKVQRKRDRFLALLEDAFVKMMSLSGIQTVEELKESFLNRTEREGKFEMLLEQNKNKIDKLTDIRQELDLELLKVKFSGSANDAERDEIQECKEEIARVRREVQQKKLKMYAVDTNLIRVRSSFEYLANKLREVELDEDQVDEILARAEEAQQTMPISSEAAPAEGGDEEDSEEEAAQEDSMEADLSLEVGGADISQIEGGDPTVQLQDAEEGAQQMGPKEIKMEMKKVQDPKTGVLAKMRESIAKLEYIYQCLSEQKGSVPAQSKQSAEAKVSGTKNLEEWLSKNGITARAVALSDAEYNYRLPLTKVSTTPRRTDEDDNDEDLEDAHTLKVKADRLVAKKKREIAAMYDEFGNLRVEVPKKDEKTKRK